jgi:hypothetical protein
VWNGTICIRWGSSIYTDGRGRSLIGTEKIVASWSAEFVTKCDESALAQREVRAEA